MADVVTPAASAASAVATAAALTGAPPDMVLFGAVIGAAISLWTRKSAPPELSGKWLLGAFFHFATAVAVGIVGSTMLVSIAAAYDWTSGLTRAPQWTWSVTLAGGMEFFLPFAGAALRNRFSGGGQ